jgi:predicted porin
MKKTQIALAAVALVASSVAMAQESGVKVSGRFDIGYQSGTGGSTVTSGLNDSLLAPNLIGFSGSEDLDGGLKADFNIVTTFTPAKFSSFQSAGFIFLQQNVGLSGDFGGVRVGQQVDSFWGKGIANFDVTGGGNMGSAVSTVFMHGASGVFHDNAISYNTPSIGGLNAGATYIVNGNGAGDGGTARSSAVIDKGSYSIAGTYDIGSIKVGAGYSSLKAADASTGNTSTFVAAGTDLGVAVVNVLYVSSSKTQGFDATATAGKANTFGINSSIPLVGALTGVVGYYSTDGTVINGSNTSAGLRYALSKRTTLFGNWEKATGNTILGIGQNGGGQGTAGTITTVGIGHSF